MPTRKHKKKGGETGPKRSPDEILRDKAVIAQWLLEGNSHELIAKKLSTIRAYDISRETISKDIREVRASWLAITIEAYDKTKQIELARIEEDEKRILAAMDAYRIPRSQVTRENRDESSSEKVVQEEPGTGDALPPLPNVALFSALDRVRARRCKILGFDANQSADDLDASILAVIRAGYEVKLPGDSDEISGEEP